VEMRMTEYKKLVIISNIQLSFMPVRGRLS